MQAIFYHLIFDFAGRGVHPVQQTRSIKTNPDSVNERPADTSKTEHKPKLLDRLREALRARHYSRRTEQTYCHWIKRFIFFHKVRHPAEMAEPEINAFLTHLAVEEKVSASTQNKEWRWQRVFTQENRWKNTVTGEEERHHIHKTVLQRAVKEAVRNAGAWLPHLPPLFCHAFA